MEEGNTKPSNISGLAEMIFVALGLALLFIVPMLYSLDPPSVNPLGAGPESQASFSLKKP